MGLSFLSSSSSSSQTTELQDKRIGADNGANALGVVLARSHNNTLNIGSDDVAKHSIDAIKQITKDTLTATTDFISKAFTDFLNVTDRRFEAADNNIAAQNQLTETLLTNQQNQAAALISQESQSADDRLLKLLKMAMIAGVGVVALQSGALKEIKGAFK